MSDDINRRIAEKLEPDPKDNEYSDGNSKGGMWVWCKYSLITSGGEWKPRPFDTDPAASLELIKAMREWDDELGLLWIAHGRVGFGLSHIYVEWDQKAETLCEAIRDAVAKAVGVES